MDINDDDLIEKLMRIFDIAFKINLSGEGTDLTRMITTFVPDAIQELSYFYGVYNEK